MRASVYLVLRPEHSWDGRVTAIIPDRILKSKPKLGRSEVAVQLHLDVDVRLFEQFLPEVVVAITGAGVLVVPEVVIQEQPESDEAADEAAG